MNVQDPSRGFEPESLSDRTQRNWRVTWHQCTRSRNNRGTRDVALESLPLDSPPKPPLTRILQLLKQAIEESRNAVLRLRSSSGENLGLEHAFSEVNQEFDFQQQIAFRIVVVGRPRTLRGAVHEHVYLI